jgi:hypothetical protein
MLVITKLIKEFRFNRLGYQWAGSLLGFIGLACCAIPFVFYYKGEAIRRYSKFAYSPDEEDVIFKKEPQYISAST